MTGQPAADYSWADDIGSVDLDELSNLAIWRDPARAIDAGLLNPQPPASPPR